ncbi:hypothetical protein V7161_22550 [Neobacillus drentensis]
MKRKSVFIFGVVPLASYLVEILPMAASEQVGVITYSPLRADF